MEPGESSAKKRFGAELRAHRTRRGWTQVELGAKIGYSGSYVSDVERGDKGATDDFAKRCDSEDAFDLPGTFLRLWEDLQRESFPTWFAPVVPIEREATKITGWELGAVPGLLQTEDYARALIRARKPHDDEEAVERILQGRLDRQGILVRPKSPQLTYVIHEGALRHVIGDREANWTASSRPEKPLERRSYRYSRIPHTTTRGLKVSSTFTSAPGSPPWPTRSASAAHA